MTEHPKAVHVEILIDGRKHHSFLAERLVTNETRTELTLTAARWQPEAVPLPDNPTLADLNTGASGANISDLILICPRCEHVLDDNGVGHTPDCAELPAPYLARLDVDPDGPRIPMYDRGEQIGWIDPRDLNNSQIPVHPFKEGDN